MMAELNTLQVEKRDTTMGEKGEKSGVDVEVVESQQPPQRSTRERFARFTNSIFTKQTFNDTWSILWKFARFAGPGAVISVAYVDPDNLQSNVTAGAEFKFKLLFMILFSNIVAVFLQVCNLSRFPAWTSQLTDNNAGIVNEAGLCYRHGLGSNESSFSSSMAEHSSLAVG
jgi:hypothetical protein